MRSACRASRSVGPGLGGGRRHIAPHTSQCRSVKVCGAGDTVFHALLRLFFGEISIIFICYHKNGEIGKNRATLRRAAVKSGGF